MNGGTMKQVVFVSAVRTAVGSFGGSLKNTSPSELASQVIAAAVKKSTVDLETIGHCVLGHVVQTEAHDMYVARKAAMLAGLSHTVPAYSVNRLCGSGMQAVVSAAQQIQLGLAETVVAGGVEVMSRGGYLATGARFGNRLGDGKLIDMMLGALNCPIENYHMGVTAENVAERWKISREQQDVMALESHQKAENAIKSGYFQSQIVPIEVKDKKSTHQFSQDEHVRFGITIDDLQKLQPVFKDGGTVTAGNASGINDGAAALVMMDEDACERQGMTPSARLVGYSVAGVEPKYMGIGPVPAVQKLLRTHAVKVSDIDIWEINEAFASQALAVVKDLGIDKDKVNPNGSGISLGHPVGASGAILSVKAIAELQRQQARYAVVTMCIGGGQGIAALIERI